MNNIIIYKSVENSKKDVWLEENCFSFALSLYYPIPLSLQPIYHKTLVRSGIVDSKLKTQNIVFHFLNRLLHIILIQIPNEVQQ
jgi:hypothetical protein